MNMQRMIIYPLLSLMILVLGGYLFPISTIQAGAPLEVNFNCGDVSELSFGECNALVALYNATDGPSWTDQGDWLVTNSPCTWLGVECVDGTIEELLLESNNLHGQLPTQLKNLPNLAFLDLSQNNLIGVIPNEIGEISNLEELYLNQNPDLTGALPQSLSNLNLGLLWFDGTQVCIPNDSALSVWMNAIDDLQSSNIFCTPLPRAQFLPIIQQTE